VCSVQGLVDAPKQKYNATTVMSCLQGLRTLP
jgi:hypothetical protein